MESGQFGCVKSILSNGRVDGSEKFMSIMALVEIYKKNACLYPSTKDACVLDCRQVVIWEVDTARNFFFMTSKRQMVFYNC